MAARSDTEYVKLDLETPRERKKYRAEQLELEKKGKDYVRALVPFIEQLDQPIHTRTRSGTKYIVFLRIDFTECCMPSSGVKKTIDDDDLYVGYERFDVGMDLKMRSLLEFLKVTNYHFDITKGYYEGCRMVVNHNESGRKLELLIIDPKAMSKSD